MADELNQKVESAIRSAPVSDEIRAKAWDSFFLSTTPQKFRSQFDGLELPREVKAQLWELRFPQSERTPPPAIPLNPARRPDYGPSREQLMGPWQQRPIAEIPSPMAPPSAGQSGPEQFVRGAAQGVTGAASQFTTPQNLATMSAIAAGSLIPGVGPAVAGTAGVVFTYEMAKNLVQSLPQGWAAMKKGDWATVGRLFGEDVVNALAMRGAAKATTGTLRPALEARAARMAPPLRYAPAPPEPETTITAETEPRYAPDYTPVTPRLAPGGPPPGTLPAGGPGPRQLPAPRTSQPIDQFSRASGVPLPRVERLADMSVEELRGRREYLARALRSETSRIPDPFQTEPSAVARGKEAGAPELRPTPALKPGEPRFQTRESAQREIQAIDLLIEDKLGQMGLRPSPGASLFEPPRPPAPPPRPEAAPPVPPPAPPAPTERPVLPVSEPPYPKPRKPRAKPKPEPPTEPPTEPPPGTEVVAKKTITPPPPGAPPAESAPPAAGIDVSNVVPEARARIQRVFETVQAHGGSGVIEITVTRPGKREIRIGANVNLDTPADIIQQIQRAGGSGTAEFLDPANKVKWRIELTPEQTPPPGAPPNKGPRLGSERGGITLMPRPSKMAETVAGPKIETARGYWIGPTGEAMNIGRDMHDWKLPKGMSTMQQAMEKGWIRVREDIVETDARNLGSVGFMDAFQMAAQSPHAKNAGRVVVQLGRKYVEVPLSRVEEFLGDPEKYVRNWRGEMFSQTAPPSAGLEYA